MLTEVRFQLIRALNLRGMVAGSAIMDYHKVADHVLVEQYLQDVIDGKRSDTNLSKQLHMGFQALAIIPNYVPEDWRARGYGVTIVWHNPDYKPGMQITQPVQPARYEVVLKPVPDPTIAA
jgi:hypothetical protein